MDYNAKFLLIWLAMISTGIVGAIVGLTIVGVTAFKKGDATMADKFVELFARAEFVRLITAIVIVIAVCALAFAHIISGEVTGTLLGAIAGYVLGGMSKAKRGSKKEEKGKDA
jgi:CBS domain containing-hemolysin-like protein